MFPRWLQRILDVADVVIQIVCVVLLAVMLASITWQVVSRYVIEQSAAWTSELAGVTFVWLAMLGISLGVRRGRHMTLDIWEYVPYRRGLYLSVVGFSGLAVIAVLAILAYFGFDGLGASFSRDMPGLGLSYGWQSLAVPAGCTISLVFAIEVLWKTLMAKQGEDPLPAGVIFQPEAEIIVKGEV